MDVRSAAFDRACSWARVGYEAAEAQQYQTACEHLARYLLSGYLSASPTMRLDLIANTVHHQIKARSAMAWFHAR
jgi:hypothetical protein